VADHRLLPHFLYHLLLAVASGFSSDVARLTAAAVAVLSLLVVAKLLLGVGLLRALADQAGAPLTPAAALVAAVALFFVAPLPNWWRPDDIYLGQLSATIWHNPTVITLMPLAIAVFWGFVRNASEPRRSGELLTGALLALSALAKPNFALAFVPSALVLRLRRRPDLPGLAGLIGPVAGVLAWQCYHALGSGLEPAGHGLVEIRPLLVWSFCSPHPLLSTLLSLAFPLAVTAAVGRHARHPGALLAAWLLTLVALAQFALLAEPEPRTGDANYYWGVVPGVFLLFLVSIAELVAPGGPGRPARGLRRACWAILLLHVASGVFLYCYPFQLAVEF
jgi:hypothetical protein